MAGAECDAHHEKEEHGAAVSYPVFTYSWAEDAFNHYVKHGLFKHKCDTQLIENGRYLDRSDCKWCRRANDERVHLFLVNKLIRIPIIRILTFYFEHFEKQCSGSNSCVLQKGQLAKEDCLSILDEWPKNDGIDENLLWSDDTDIAKAAYVKSCDSKIKKLLSTYLPGCLEAVVPTSGEKSSGEFASGLTKLLFSLPDHVAQYAPIVQHTNGFQTIVYRYRILCPDSGTILPHPDVLTLNDINFLFLCLHTCHLVTPKPVSLLYMWGHVIPEEVILYLCRRYDSDRRHKERLQQEIEVLLDL